MPKTTKYIHNKYQFFANKTGFVENVEIRIVISEQTYFEDKLVSLASEKLENLKRVVFDMCFVSPIWKTHEEAKEIKDYTKIRTV